MILTNALTWFFLRTVPTSKNAKPACIASTKMEEIAAEAGAEISIALLEKLGFAAARTLPEGLQLFLR